MKRKIKFVMTLSTQATDIEKRIFNFVLKSKLKGPEKYSEYKKIAQQFLDTNKDVVSVDQLKDVNFFDTSIYPKIKRECNNEFVEKMFILDYVVFTIKNILSGVEPVEYISEETVRQASPPFEAYVPVPVAKLDISPFSKNSSALLFEKR